jgi:hypothetical protein
MTVRIQETEGAYKLHLTLVDSLLLAGSVFQLETNIALTKFTVFKYGVKVNFLGLRSANVWDVVPCSLVEANRRFDEATTSIFGPEIYVVQAGSLQSTFFRNAGKFPPKFMASLPKK